MAQAKSMCLRIILSLALALSFLTFQPGESFASNDEPSDQAQASVLQEDSLVPTSQQLENAASNQLIVTYASDALGIQDSLEVASIDGDSLESVASSEPSMETTLSELGGISSNEISDGDFDSNKGASTLVTFEEGSNLQEISAQLLSSPDVASVQPNYEYELFALGSTNYYDATESKEAYHPTNDPYSFVSESKNLNQSYIYTTKVADAWSKGYKSNSKVSIAVIDSGPRLDHPDLKSIWDLTYARDFTTDYFGDGVPYEDTASNWEGKTGFECHGTWVSGILGASANNGLGIAGTSYNAKVVPLKVTGGRTLYTSTIVRAYSYLDSLLEEGKLNDLKVVNLSLGGRESDSKLKSAIDHFANSHNILTVAAAGNYGDSDNMYPADFPNVLSVMAVNSDYTRASFSNYGNKDVSAPGVNLTTTIPYSSSWSSSAASKYAKNGISGTSFSTPIVSGIAALCYSVKPSASAKEIKYSITSAAVSLKSIDSTCAPYVDALQAVKNVISGKGLFEATHYSISGAKVSSISTKTYSGKKIKPTPKVTLNGKTLKRGVDYTLVYSNNAKPGRATVTVKASGIYKGSVKTTFKIIPKSTVIKKPKRARKALVVKWAKRSACASGYQIRYSLKSKLNSSKMLKTGRNLTVSGKNKTSKKITSLKSRTKYYVQVRVYKKTNGVMYYSKWSKLRSATTK